MSEFSESFHVRSSKQADGVDLLRRAGLGGAVFSAVRGWVTVVPEGELCEAVDQMVGANQGILLHYLYAEDHGWQFELYENSSAICRYQCGWDPRFAIDDSEMNQSVVVPLLVEGSRERALEDILHPADVEAVIMEAPAYRFANAVGLEHYEWLSGRYLDEIEERDPSAIVVK
jgi:hypothetical protein